MMCWFLTHPHGRVTAMAPEAIILFSFAFLCSVGQLIRPSRLRITHDGFSLEFLLWSTKHRWAEVDDVWIAERFNSPAVVWRFKPRQKTVPALSPAQQQKYDGILSVLWHGKQREIGVRMIAALDDYELVSKRTQVIHL
jgi:hypothetical protein